MRRLSDYKATSCCGVAGPLLAVRLLHNSGRMPSQRVSDVIESIVVQRPSEHRVHTFSCRNEKIREPFPHPAVVARS